MFGPPGGLGVRDVAALVDNALKPGQGPRRFLASGTYLSWEEWAAERTKPVGREVPFTAASAEDMIEMGKQFDVMRAAGETTMPLSEEAAIIMAVGVPGDNGPTLNALSVTYRPVVATIRDAVTWPVDNEHLADP
jgi:dihydroflavonol-4-reductase